MKLRTTIAVVMLFACAALAQAADGVQFITVTSWQQALDLAKAQNKPIFLDAYTDWCGWCKVMDRETFSDPEVAAVMNAAFVNVKMEMETGEGVDVAMKYRITGFPTFMVFAVDGTPTFRTFGYQPPKDWLATLADMQDASKRRTMAGVTPSITLPWPDWHRASFVKGKERRFPDTALVRSWFRSQPDKFNEVSFGVLLRHDMGEEIEQWALANEAQYRRLYGDDVDDLREGLVRRALSRAIMNKDVALLQQAKDLVPGRDPQSRARTHRRLEATYRERTNDWKGVGGMVQTIANSADLASEAEYLNELSWSIYEKTDDADAIAAAIDGMSKVVALPDVDWAHVDTYAALLYKAGRLTEARAAAERAITRGTAQGADVSETEELLAKIKAASK